MAVSLEGKRIDSTVISTFTFFFLANAFAYAASMAARPRMVVPASSMYSPSSVHEAATAFASPFSTTLMKSAVALRTASSSSARFVSLGSAGALAGTAFSCAAVPF